MKKILVSGLVNIETSLKVESFHLIDIQVTYPFFGITTKVSGTGMNIAKAISVLGGTPVLTSLIGTDNSAKYIAEELERLRISGKYVEEGLKETPQTVVLYDRNGHSQMHVDLKDIQDNFFAESIYKNAIKGCEITALCNINFSRPFLKIARDNGKLIATDVHAIADLHDPYNQEFMKNADILFLSDEGISCDIRDFVNELKANYECSVIVAGMGERGALLYYRNDNYMEFFPAVRTRTVINPTGAGDALFAAFLYFYNKTRDPYLSLSKAMIFASYKIGEADSSEGFITEKELDITAYTVIR